MTAVYLLTGFSCGMMLGAVYVYLRAVARGMRFHSYIPLTCAFAVPVTVLAALTVRNAAEIGVLVYAEAVVMLAMALFIRNYRGQRTERR